MGGQVGLSDHVSIGDEAVIGAKSGVVRDLEARTRYLGWPAVPEGEQKRTWITLQKLVEMRRDLLMIKKRLGLSAKEAA